MGARAISLNDFLFFRDILVETVMPQKLGFFAFIINIFRFFCRDFMAFSEAYFWGISVLELCLSLFLTYRY